MFQHGGLAQLVERVLSMHEVVGSIPTFSRVKCVTRLSNVFLTFSGPVDESSGFTFCCACYTHFYEFLCAKQKYCLHNKKYYPI